MPNLRYREIWIAFNKIATRYRPWFLIVALPLVGLPGTRAASEVYSAAMPNGVACGDVTGTRAVLWAHSTNLGPLRFEYGLNSAYTPVAGMKEVAVIDPSLPAKVEVTGLQPGTRYGYRATDAAGHQVEGRFRTPWNDAAFHGLRFGVSGDWRGELAPYPALQNAADRDLDFFVALGDTIYADYASPAVPTPTARSLAEFRAKHNEVYAEHLGMNTFAWLRAATAFYVMIDDHEVVNNFAGGAAPSADPRFDLAGAYINETMLYRTALQAFHEYNPIRQEWYDTPGIPRTHGKPRLYRTQRFGKDAALFLLDARSFRDPELTAVANPLNAAQVNAFNSRTFDIDPADGQPLPQRTLLGGPQLAELKADLLGAQNDHLLWKFVFLPEPIQQLGFVNAQDRYEGYARERAELLQFIIDHWIDNVVFVAADLHGTIVNNVNNQTGPGKPLTPSGSFEVVTGPVAFDQPFGPTALDLAARTSLFPGFTLLDFLLGRLGLANRAAYDALPLSEKDRSFKSIMDFQLNAISLDATGLDGSDINARLVEGGYVAVHTYGWTEFQVDAATHQLSVITYGIPAYSVAPMDVSITNRVPEIVSRFTVMPRGPSLRIAWAGEEWRISWPTHPIPFVLESSGSPEASAAWSNVTDPVLPAGDQNTVSIMPTGESRFFRLRSH